MISLLFRNLVFTILQPGIVAGLIPYLIIKFSGKTLFPDVPTFWQYAGIIIAAFGSVVMLACILSFAVKGKGTLSPLDPTKKLVISGLYRYSRNPMYLGVMSLLIGESVFWQSIELAFYSVIVFTAFQLFIIFHEEPRLKRDFGNEFEEYCRTVRRWL